MARGDRHVLASVLCTLALLAGTTDSHSSTGEAGYRLLDSPPACHPLGSSHPLAASVQHYHSMSLTLFEGNTRDGRA